ncbi:MAG: hypothetical protein FAF03_07320 [Epsilonproteobacteria bacterium]|nr:hypothetical protein [Campylobacterota bacterium]
MHVILVGNVGMGMVVVVVGIEVEEGDEDNKMKRFTIYIMIVFILSSTLYAEEDNASSEENKVTTVYTDLTKKSEKTTKEKSESHYDKFKRILSKYDGNFAKDTLIYSADAMIPDEIFVTLKDVIDNRKENTYSSSLRTFSKMLGNDTYNVLLTTTYHYMQDISRIHHKIWDHAVCHPDVFQYDPNLNPKTILLDLKQNDEKARGITEEGIVLPYNQNFPNTLYPYASQPNGCSAEELQSLYNNSNKISDDAIWLKEACDEHDKCYSTIGTTFQECNDKLIVQTVDSCTQISNRDTLLYLGSKNAFCGMKALAISTGAGVCAEQYFNHTQRQQKIYNRWVLEYEEAYQKAKQFHKKWLL